MGRPGQGLHGPLWKHAFTRTRPTKVRYAPVWKRKTLVIQLYCYPSKPTFISRLCGALNGQTSALVSSFCHALSDEALIVDVIVLLWRVWDRYNVDSDHKLSKEELLLMMEDLTEIKSGHRNVPSVIQSQQQSTCYKTCVSTPRNFNLITRLDGNISPECVNPVTLRREIW